MQVLRIFVAVVFLSCAAVSSAQQPDQIVSKVVPESCHDQRTEAHQDAERQKIRNRGGNVNLLVAHYCELCNVYNIIIMQ